jgi:hypothetical protein
MIPSIILKSPPPENPLPSPRRIATRASVSASTSRQISVSSAWVSESAVASLPGSPITISTMPSGWRFTFSRRYFA